MGQLIANFTPHISYAHNNRSLTVLESFVAATERHGNPSRLRTDKGGENVKLCEFMEEHRGVGRNSYITGKSVHNTRIKRLWRDNYV